MAIWSRKFILSSIAPLLLIGCAAGLRKTDDATAIGSERNPVRVVALEVTGSADSMHSADWEVFKALWRNTMKSDLSLLGRPFAVEEADTRTSMGPETLVVVDIENYRHRSSVAWYGLGAMSANAFVQGRVSVRDLRTGEARPVLEFDTLSNKWQSATYATTNDQVNAICREIIASLSKG